jgi:hypothetical protein
VNTTRPQRYDQCDDDCTVDCGHCKGKGRPEPLAALRDRLMRADRELAYIRRNSEPLSVERLDGKIAGVRLALSYVDEALRMAKPAEEPQP